MSLLSSELLNNIMGDGIVIFICPLVTTIIVPASDFNTRVLVRNMTGEFKASCLRAAHWLFYSTQSVKGL